MASHLAELCPDAKIAVFEALKLGNGDSGKNAGFIIDVPHNFGDQGNSTFDDNFMYYKLNTFIISYMRKKIEESGIKVDWDPCGKYLCCVEPKSFKMMEEEARDLDKMKVHYEIYEGEDLARRIGTHYYKKALYTPGTLLVNPADVLRGLYSVLPENVSVFEECPVMGIANGSPAHVYLLNGKEITTKVVVVTGGPFIEEFGIVKHTFCPVSSTIGKCTSSKASSPGAARPAIPLERRSVSPPTTASLCATASATRRALPLRISASAAPSPSSARRSRIASPKSGMSISNSSTAA